MGDRLAHLRLAWQIISAIPDLIVKQVSPVYLSDALLPENAADDWNQPYLNLALKIETKLEPLDLLHRLKKIEIDIGRKPAKRHWGPRIIDIDILAWDDVIIKEDALTVPHSSLQERPFALWPLADIAPQWKFPLEGPYHQKTAAQIVEQWGSRFSGEAPFHTRQLYQRIDTPQLIGVINVTPDSYSDGGQAFDPDHALQQALSLVEAGATILDIGAEATSPRASLIDSKTEWQRLEPVLTRIHAARSEFCVVPIISVDTRRAEIAEKALAQGADWINDVTGLDDVRMREVLLSSNADCIVMHHLSIPASDDDNLPRDQDPASLVYAWAKKRIDELVKQGIKREKIIFDPGIGFGKMAEQSLLLLQHAQVFKSLGVRVLIAHSRKRFHALFTNKPAHERDIETATAAVYLANQTSVDYLRVHNVEMCARALRMNAALFPQ